MATYYVPNGNWTSQVVGNIGSNPINVLNYNISSESKDDPAVGCRKEFTAEYKCGMSSSTSKIVTVPPEAGGRTARFNCEKEYIQCNDLKLILTDNGKLTLTTLDGSKTLWDSVTAFGENGKMPTNSNIKTLGQTISEDSNIFISNPAYAANSSNTTSLVISGAGRKYNTNYLLPGQLLEIDQWIGSPTGTCRLIMKIDGLQVVANQVGCDALDEDITTAAARDVLARAAASKAALDKAAADKAAADQAALITNVSTYTIQDKGCWNDNAARTLKGGPQRYGYTVETCANEAKNRNASIFGLQHGGWCSTSDKNISGDDYTKLGRSTDRCDPLGGAWQNHVYERVSIPQSVKNLGCWNDNAARSLKGGPQNWGYTVETCANEAKKRNTSIFALQAGSWCSTSDKNISGDDYTKLGRSTAQCDPHGGPWQNHVYENIDTPTQTTSGNSNPTGVQPPSIVLDTDGARLYEINPIYKDHIGKVGYVNYLGQLQLFPDDDTEYIDSYEKIGNYNMDGEKLGTEFSSPTVEDCQKRCSVKNSGTEVTIDANGKKIPVTVPANAKKCAGFVFDTERKMCQLLDKSVKNSKRIINPKNEFYMRGKGIKKNDPSCSVNTTNKNSTFWESTVKSSIGDMSNTTKCGLAKYTETERQTVNYGKKVVIDDIDNINTPDNFKSVFDKLKEKYKNLINRITNTNTNIKNKFNDLKNTKKDLADWSGEQLQNLEAMDADTDLNMMSQNYRHIMWSILAIMIIITTIKLRK